MLDKLEPPSKVKKTPSDIKKLQPKAKPDAKDQPRRTFSDFFYNYEKYRSFFYTLVIVMIVLVSISIVLPGSPNYRDVSFGYYPTIRIEQDSTLSKLYDYYTTQRSRKIFSKSFTSRLPNVFEQYNSQLSQVADSKKSVAHVINPLHNIFSVSQWNLQLMARKFPNLAEYFQLLLG